MTRPRVAGCAFAILLALAVGYWALNKYVLPAAPTWTAAAPSTTLVTAQTHAAPDTHKGFLYGRITTADGDTYEGRLRWGGHEEAFWGDYFNGFKDENPWAAHVPPEQLEEPRRFKIFGVEIANREHQIDLDRPFMARFGDIARIEAHGRDLRVTLKSGTVFDLDRFSADDFADGVRVWDGRREVLDFEETRIRTIELRPPPRWTPPPTDSTVPCARDRATSPASSSGTGRSASARMSSMATPRTVHSAYVSTAFAR